jgi:hypothetical protein
MRSSAGLVIAAIWIWIAFPAIADERVEGVVRNTVVTHCDATRRGGCAGTLTLERRAGGGSGTLKIRVPLGTPISRGLEHATLGSLEGQTVIVTTTAKPGGQVRALSK